VGLLAIGTGISGCGQGQESTLTIDAPSDAATLLTEGAGDDFTYFVLEESPPGSWQEVSSGTLWICSEDERPPLVPENIASLIDGGAFPAGTQLNLEWSDEPDVRDSSELDIDEIIVTVGITYEGCTEGALEAMKNGSVLLLTDTDGAFDGRDRLAAVEFD
jgi:hypothetical protein